MNLMNYPMLLFVICLFLMWLSVQVGSYLRRRRAKIEQAEREDLELILGACLTLLGLLIGFSFSMATSRYDQRKNYEEEEANAIGTEYLRLGFLPPPDAAKARQLLKSYLDQRILFYTERDPARINRINAFTTQLQNDLWSAVQIPGAAQPTPVNALVAAGMNDVINRQGYTQAAWWNRLPVETWILMMAIAISCNGVFGYNAHHPDSRYRRFFFLPLIVAVALFLIADLDSPRGGLIRVVPQNLVSLSSSLATGQ